MTPQIVATGPIDPVATELLRAVGEILVAPDASETSLLPLLPHAIALIVRGDGVANARVIDAAPHLRVIGRSGAGYDNVDIRVATARKIPVVYTPGANARAVAEGAVAFLLALCKRIPFWDQQLKQGNWKSRFSAHSGDLDGATLGIIGFGRIGQILAECVRAFRMTILVYDPYANPTVAAEHGVELVTLEELLRRSDFISLHAPLTAETRGLINRERLRLVKRGAYLINLARGGLVENLDVLHEALREERLAGVGLDVFEPEPPDVSHPIFQMPNCLTAPHVLGLSQRATRAIFQSMAEDMVAVLMGKRPRFVVNPEVLP